MSDDVVCFQYPFRGSIVVHGIPSHAVNPLYFQFIINATELRRHPAYSLSYIVVSDSTVYCILIMHIVMHDLSPEAGPIYSYTYLQILLLNNVKMTMSSSFVRKTFFFDFFPLFPSGKIPTFFLFC